MEKQTLAEIAAFIEKHGAINVLDAIRMTIRTVSDEERATGRKTEEQEIAAFIENELDGMFDTLEREFYTL